MAYYTGSLRKIQLWGLSRSIDIIEEEWVFCRAEAGMLMLRFHNSKIVYESGMVINGEGSRGHMGIFYLHILYLGIF